MIFNVCRRISSGRANVVMSRFETDLSCGSASTACVTSGSEVAGFGRTSEVKLRGRSPMVSKSISVSFGNCNSVRDEGRADKSACSLIFSLMRVKVRGRAVNSLVPKDDDLDVKWMDSTVRERGSDAMKVGRSTWAGRLSPLTL